MALVDDLNISLLYTEKLNIYKAFFSVDEHAVSKFKMQRIERLHLTDRTRIKRLDRKTI
jgi:insertion element IS1 protein InsB